MTSEKAFAVEQRLNLLVSPGIDTWHDLAPTLAGWSQLGSHDPFQYRLVAPGLVEITGCVTGGALGAGAQTIATIPAGYRPPTNTSSGMPIVSVGRNAINDPPYMTVSTAGVMSINNAQGATQLQFNCFYPITANPT